MARGNVINDLHYDGKTVIERLTADGLAERFQAAVQAKDASRMVEILEQVAMAHSWAERLATTILDGPGQSPIRLALDDPRNAGVIRHFQRGNELKFPPCMRPVESPRDPYLQLGSHPDIVEHVWDHLGSTLPGDCRCIVFGTPALVAPRSGIMLAQAFGTQYALRIPRQAMDQALQGGARVQVQWAGGSITDLAHEYGNDWIFGRWLKQEPAWLLAVYNAAEQSRAT